jgi:hypothetical protein
MAKFTLYTYDLWADQSNCNDCHSPRIDDIGCLECKSRDIHTSYSVNDVFRVQTIEADTLEAAMIEMGLHLDKIEEDLNIDNSMNIVYFRYTDKAGKFAYSPACEIRIECN